MVVVGLAFWVFAIAWPGTQVAILVLASALVAFAVYGLLTEQYGSTRMRSCAASASVSRWKEVSK